MQLATRLVGKFTPRGRQAIRPCLLVTMSLHRGLLVRDLGEGATRLQAASVIILRVLRRRLVGVEQAEGLRVARH